MRLCFALVFLFSFLSLATCADRAAGDCRGAWIAVSNPPSGFDGLGVNIHFTDPRPGEIKMIADAGFRWVRMDFKWDAIERERGRYNFSSYDRLLAALDAYQLHAMLILDYGNPLYDNGAPPRNEITRMAFTRWATAAAKHFAGRGVVWEVYNEPNLATFWPAPNVGEYVALALSVGRAFHATAPQEKLIGPATSGIDLSFLEACFQAGLLDYWSAVSVHPYRRSDPETVASDYCRLRKMIEAYRSQSGSNAMIPIISSEWGYSSVWRGLNEEKQAEMFAREMLTNVANGIPISIWYDWRDDGVDPNEAEHHFGLARNADRSGRDQADQPKPGFLAANTLSDYFRGYAYQKRLPIGSNDDYVLVFAKGGTTRVTVWTTSASPHRVLIPLGAGAFTVTKHTGQSDGSISAGPKGPEIEISGAPLYLTHR
jgi:hypothetical protein